MSRIIDEYPIVASGAGWVDVSRRGRLRFEGRDATSFLQALVSNDVAGVELGGGVYATYLTPQGRMIADMELYRLADGWLAGVAPGLGGSLAERFDQSIFSEDVRVADDSSRTFELFTAGARSASVLSAALSVGRVAIESLPPLGHIAWEDGLVVRASESRLPNFRVIGAVDRAPIAIERLEAAGARSISQDLAEALRIEAGRPKFGVDMTEETIPLEAGLLDRAISTTKGCYVGQEIVIRILHRGGGRVARRLAMLSIAGGADDLVPGVALWKDGREAGRLTSLSVSPSSGLPIALGYVARDSAEVGQRLTAGGPDASASAVITGFAA